MSSRIITLVLSAGLASCATLSVPFSLDENQTTELISPPAIVSQSKDRARTITLERIMADPEWMGREPQNPYWGDASQSIFYSQKREGSKIHDLFVQEPEPGSTPQKVTLETLHDASTRSALSRKDDAFSAWVFEGNIFLKDLVSGQVTQVSATSKAERSPLFLNDNRLAFQVAQTWFAFDIKTRQTRELVTLVAAKAPENTKDPESYIAKQQHKLIKFVAGELSDAKAGEEQKKVLEKENSTLVARPFYFGKDKEIVVSALSPNADRLIVAVRDKRSPDKKDIMPNYVSADGTLEAKKARTRVSDAKPEGHTLYLIDLTDHTKHELEFDTLPGHDADVLASVKRENLARDGKSYTSKKEPRKISVLGWSNSVKWHQSGQAVAFFLEAWDNKDRWLTTVDFENKKLVSQDRLHDDAWINYAHSEFMWANTSQTLFYLSEKPGYSHLFARVPGKKAKALTSGRYNVNDLTLTKKDDFIYYRANKGHPGVYEIHRVNLSSKTSEQVTSLGGMNSFVLSPDEDALLVTHSSVTMPPELYVKTIGGKGAQRLTHTVSEEFLSFPWAVPQIVAVPSDKAGAPIYSRVYRPIETSTQKRKAVMFTHGAGYLQNAHAGWSGYFREYMFHSMLVQQGYVVMDMDWRASKGYGRDWRTAIYRNIGKPELEDLRTGVNWMVENANVDRARIGTYGGSYGGFLTLMALFQEPDLFEAGAALRLVSDWAYYNTWYSSNILNTPDTDPIAYERSSPIYFAEGLQKPLLMNAPMVDSNVFFQDTVRLVQRLIELEKTDFETAIFPVEPHGFRQPSSWLNEYRKIYKLFEDNL